MLSRLFSAAAPNEKRKPLSSNGASSGKQCPVTPKDIAPSSLNRSASGKLIVHDRRQLMELRYKEEAKAREQKEEAKARKQKAKQQEQAHTETGSDESALKGKRRMRDRRSALCRDRQSALGKTIEGRRKREEVEKEQIEMRQRAESYQQTVKHAIDELNKLRPLATSVLKRFIEKVDEYDALEREREEKASRTSGSGEEAIEKSSSEIGLGDIAHGDGEHCDGQSARTRGDDLEPFYDCSSSIPDTEGAQISLAGPGVTPLSQRVGGSVFSPSKHGHHHKDKDKDAAPRSCSSGVGVGGGVGSTLYSSGKKQLSSKEIGALLNRCGVDADAVRRFKRDLLMAYQAEGDKEGGVDERPIDSSFFPLPLTSNPFQRTPVAAAVSSCNEERIRPPLRGNNQPRAPSQTNGSICFAPRPPPSPTTASSSSAEPQRSFKHQNPSSLVVPKEEQQACTVPVLASGVCESQQPMSPLASQSRSEEEGNQPIADPCQENENQTPVLGSEEEIVGREKEFHHLNKAQNPHVVRCNSNGMSRSTTTGWSSTMTCSESSTMTCSAVGNGHCPSSSSSSTATAAGSSSLQQGNSHQNARTRLAHAERTVQVRSSENGVQVRTDDNGVQVNESKKETTWEWSALSSIEGTVFDQLDPMPVQAIDIRAIQALFKKKEGSTKDSTSSDNKALLRIFKPNRIRELEISLEQLKFGKCKRKEGVIRLARKLHSLGLARDESMRPSSCEFILSFVPLPEEVLMFNRYFVFSEDPDSELGFEKRMMSSFVPPSRGTVERKEGCKKSAREQERSKRETGSTRSSSSDPRKPYTRTYWSPPDIPNLEAELCPLFLIPRLPHRLRAVFFIVSLGKFSGVEKALHALSSEAARVIQNRALQDLIRVALSLGNYVNSGAVEGPVAGFRLSSLLTARNVRLPLDEDSTSTSLLHVLILHVGACRPDIPIDLAIRVWATELRCLHLDVQLDFQELKSLVRTYEKEVVFLANELYGDSPDAYSKIALGVLEEMYEEAAPRSAQLLDALAETEAQLETTCTYLGYPKGHEAELLQTLKEIQHTYVNAAEELLKHSSQLASFSITDI